MKEKLSTKKALYLYGIILGFVFIFYLAALQFGGSNDSETISNPPATGQIDESPAEIQESVEFYEDLPKPLETDQKAEAVPAAKSPDRTPEPSAVSEAPKKETSGPAEVRTVDSSPGSAGNFTVQTGAFSTDKEARQMILKLRTKNFNGKIQNPFDSTDKFFRVWVGDFENRSDALKMEAELKEAGFPTYIRKIP